MPAPPTGSRRECKPVPPPSHTRSLARSPPPPPPPRPPPPCLAPPRPPPRSLPHADGFPLKKAQQYAALRKPYLVNDVLAQDTLLDRRRVYRKLTVCGAGRSRAERGRGGGGGLWHCVYTKGRRCVLLIRRQCGCDDDDEAGGRALTWRRPGPGVRRRVAGCRRAASPCRSTSSWTAPGCRQGRPTQVCVCGAAGRQARMCSRGMLETRCKPFSSTLFSCLCAFCAPPCYVPVRLHCRGLHRERGLRGAGRRAHLQALCGEASLRWGGVGYHPREVESQRGAAGTWCQGGASHARH